MPTLFFIRCSACDFRLKTDDSRTYLLLNNGQRELLPHPREYDRARELTGQELAELENAGRLELVDLYFCQNCGAIQEFPRARIESDPAAAGQLETLLKSRPCVQCRKPASWVDLFSVDGETCPRCHEGDLTSDWDIE